MELADDRTGSRIAMSVTLHLAAETERRLRERAAQKGQTLEAYLEQLADRDAGDANGTPEPPRAPGKTFDDILAPVRQGFAESGLTDEELTTLFEDAREEAWQERQEKKDPG